MKLSEQTKYSLSVIGILLIPAVLIVLILNFLDSIPPECNGTWEKLGQEEVINIIDGTKYVTYIDVLECSNHRDD